MRMSSADVIVSFGRVGNNGADTEIMADPPGRKRPRNYILAAAAVRACNESPPAIRYVSQWMGAQAVGRGSQRRSKSADLAAASESVVGDLLKTVEYRPDSIESKAWRRFRRLRRGSLLCCRMET